MRRLALTVALLGVGSLPAQQAVVQRMAGPRQSNQINVPQKVDPAQDVARLLVFGSHGPALIEAVIHIDGKPYQAHREQLVDEILKLATPPDADKPTWKQAEASKRIQAYRVGSPRFFLQGGGMMGRQQSLAAMYDKNKDGQIDRYEARLFLANEAGGPALLLADSNEAASPGAAPLWDKFDTDKDGTFSAAELDALPRGLLKHDTDDDEALTFAEMIRGPQAGRGIEFQLLSLLNETGSTSSDHAFLLNETADYQTVARAFAKHYKGIDLKDRAELAKTAPLLANLVEKLDTNRDGKLDDKELTALATITPHLRLNWQLFAGSDAKISVEQILGANGPRHVAATHVVDVSGTKIHLDPQRIGTGYSIALAGQATFEQLDTDKNGILEEKEIAKAGNAQSLVKAWDLDDDGKVTRKEHDEHAALQRAAATGRVSLSCNVVGQRLFAALDVNSDGQLGLREIQNAADNLRRLDRNKDGKLTMMELPAASLEVALSLNTQQTGRLVSLTNAFRPDEPASAPSKGPLWFRKMDYNGDGDISRREFVGTRADFERLDVNRDGFIDLEEAEAAEKKR
ncbi:MAG: hypothetical protein AB7K24_08025 [Gemmataceae bacterium]